jgi:3-phenylpropionate/cinnamic acid dioxygenase small subunit
MNETAVLDFYGAYYAALDDVRLEEWPGFFTDPCLYRIVPRENFERNLPLSTFWADSKAMLLDRVTGVRKTLVFAPRYYRRFPSAYRVSSEANGLRVRHNILVMQTLRDMPSEVVLCGESRDLLVAGQDGPLLRERVVIFDSEMILNSLIYPI